MTTKRIRSGVRCGLPTKYKRVIKQAIDRIGSVKELHGIMAHMGIDKKRENMKPIRCCCCARQMVSTDGSTERTVSGKNAIIMGPGMYACHECAKDLDENGLFPEERH